MCCFSQRVVAVSGTNIFARSSGGLKQLLVYSMTLNSKEELAMILPIPVAPGKGENAVRFIDLKGYPNFFTDLATAFLPPATRTQGMKSASAVPLGMERLAVVQVGDFVASYVPSPKDFIRLDPRFRLPADTWNQLPQYSRFGFAVFQLKPGVHKFHPMAFEFPRAEAGKLFFPTVHIHDGKVHETATFDHALYCQKIPGEQFRLTEWKESPALAQSFMNVGRSRGIIAADQHCYKLEIKGRRRNADTYLI